MDQAELVARLVSDEHGFVAVLPEVDGTEGFGPSELAAAACRSEEVVEHFTDGVVWLTAGMDPPEILLGLLKERREGADEHDDEDIEIFLEIPGDWLLVLDGVRDTAQLRACLRAADNATVLVTATTAEALPGVPSIVRVPSRARPVTAQPRLLELGAFAPGSDIPASLVPAVWRHTAGLPDQSADRLLDDYCAAGIAWRAPDRDLLLMPDTVRARLREAADPDVAHRTSRALLDYFVSDDYDPSGEAMRYCFSHLPGHLQATGAGVDGLVDRPEWIALKLALMGLAAVDRDLSMVAGERAVRLRRTLARNAHLLERGDDAEQLMATLAARMYGEADELREMLGGSDEAWLDCLWAPPDLPHPALLRSVRLGGERAVSVAIAPDATWFAMGSWDGSTAVVGAGGEVRAVLSGHEAAVTCVAVSADGTWLATSSWDQTVRTWRADGTPLAVLTGAYADVEHVAIAPGGDWLVAVADDGSVLAWSDAGVPLWHVQAGAGRYDKVALSASWVALCCDGVIRVLDADGSTRAVIETGEEEKVLGVVAHPRREAIVARHADETVRLWSPDGVQLESVKPALFPGRDCAISADGRWLAAEAHQPESIMLTRLEGPAETRFARHPALLNDVAVSADGGLVITAREPDTVQLWDALALGPLGGDVRRTLLTGVDAADDGTWLACSGDGLSLWGSGDAPIEPDTWFTAVAVLRGGTVAAGDADGKVHLFERDGTVVARLEGLDDRVDAIAAAPDGSWLAAGGQDSRIRLWRADGTALATLRAPSQQVDGLAIAPDGSWLVSCGYDQMQLWDAAGRRLSAPVRLPGLVRGVAIGPGGAWAAAAHTDGVMLVSRDGEVLATAEGLDNDANALAVSPSGEHLAVVEDDGIIRVWAVDGLRRLTMIRMDGDLNDCVWTPGGLYVAGDAGLYAFDLRLPGSPG
ncbi:hypothetical protein OIE66_23700 [Nonomuraea sp. NBC_01738]|uniref:WD40 repeat domain-containing protein n=1 Tax=Nonomuraea sp. NBC_01738 TaxID=2976003 RepID=UPI002E12AE17|nr:hypothetical protein OIE66_23700 [Nonomuraea sp. NBC_01738]